jgi:alkaline phosphatase
MPEAIVDPEDGGNNRGRRKDGRDLTKEWVQNRGQGAKFVFDKAGFMPPTPTQPPICSVCSSGRTWSMKLIA